MKQIYKKLLAAALGVSMLLSMVGCGQNDTSDQTQTGGENEAKVLTIVTAKELDNLTTLTMNKENNIACGLVYETLVAYEDGEIVPELAEEWGWDETNTVLTFKLRQDVAFTDGAAFNAESVKEILDFDRSNPNFSGIKGIYNIESVEVVDEYTVAVHYAAPCFSYINDFCFQNVAGMMSPNVFEAENFQTFTDVVGTGPYIREEMISGDCTRFVRNENYWGEAPYYDEVVIKYIPEASSRLQALQTGEVDLIYGADLLSYDDYNQALSLDGIEGAINDGNTLTRNLVLNASSEILSDLKVRQAIAYAVNKEEITKGLTYGYETPATSLFAPGAPYTDITYNSTWSYDLDKANALLDEAGWVMNESTGIREKDGQQLSLNYTYWTDLSLAQDMALAIKTQLAEVSQMKSVVGELCAVLDEKELDRPETPVSIHSSNIVLENVSFSYESEKPLLKNINLSIPENSITAFVGPSGGGKSTITKLIAGFWDVTNGTVKLDGTDIRKIPLSQLMDNIAYISQDNYLFDETVLENIRMGKPSATDEEVYQAARDCGCYDFILNLENGFHTVVGGAGGHLSGGERQRIAIARAVLKNAPIVILDEATAYIDAENEALIQEAMAKVIAGKTVLMIAHRLSTITDADKIVVIKDGQIIDEGTHENLLTSCTLYQEMWKAHMDTKDVA